MIHFMNPDYFKCILQNKTKIYYVYIEVIMVIENHSGIDKF